jgi:hypothetical protein
MCSLDAISGGGGIRLYWAAQMTLESSHVDGLTSHQIALTTILIINSILNNKVFLKQKI